MCEIRLQAIVLNPCIINEFKVIYFYIQILKTILNLVKLP